MHDLGFEKEKFLADVTHIESQGYSMLWREAIYRGGMPVVNRQLLHIRMFPETVRERDVIAEDEI